MHDLYCTSKSISSKLSCVSIHTINRHRYYVSLFEDNKMDQDDHITSFVFVPL